MPVRLRMSIHGNRNNRIFHMVAIDQRKRRDAKPIELLGIYRPALKPGETEKRVEWSVERIKYWLSTGAQPSKTFQRFLINGGIIPPKELTAPQNDTFQIKADEEFHQNQHSEETQAL